MLYTEKDWKDARSILLRRRLLAWIPAVLLFAAGIAVFVVGRINRSSSAWMISAGLWILSAFWFTFVLGVAILPAKVYFRHVDYMLNGRKRETVGIFKSFTDAVSDNGGLLCHAMMVNVGTKDDPEDDRLFYYDDFLPKPAALIGKTVRILSNDKMVASIEEN